jgi:hypothetical protein
VTITGTGFSGATAVKFGAVNATGVTVNSATSITATSPAGTGTVDTTVTTAGGTSATTAADQFTYVAAPTVTSISPTSGPGSGGTTVTISGTGFTGATAAIFGATTATTFTVNSATQITATSPAGTGTVDVRVTTTGGTSATSAADQYTYIAAPTVTSISPTSGPATGGTTVTLTGTNFTGATAVTFGATAATSFTVNSATSITATSPAGAGTIDVRATTAGGTSATSGADQFTYIGAPTVTSISPTSGPSAGGTSVTITGTTFTGATAVKFGATNATAFTVNSATSITATSPAGTGVADVTVTAAGGTSATSAADQFTYAGAPTVTSVSPTSGALAGGTSVTITGTNFTGATTVKFGASNATSFTVNSATSITAASPAGAGTVEVTVTTAGGTSATSAADQFTYFGAPTVTAISPTSGPASGGTPVTISGTNFSGVTAVKFGATAAASFTVNSATSITATSPAGAGTVDITVTAAGGTSGTSAADRFTFNAATTQTMLVSSLNPSNFGQAVKFTVTVTGSSGTPTGTVTFNDGGVAIGSAALVGGVASFTTASLKTGVHSITAAYGGSGSTFNPSTSAALTQTVNVPADSVRLHQLQVNVTKIVAQNSGQAISGAIDDAISEGFAGGGFFLTPSPSGFHFNFAADPYEEYGTTDGKTANYGSGAGPLGGTVNSYGSLSTNGNDPSSRRGNGRLEDAFAAVDRQMPTKAAPKKIREEKDWLFWIDVRGAGFDRMTTTTTVAGITTTPAQLYGTQVNAMAGLTRKLTPNFLVGVVAGYENFSFTEQDINGRLTGDGWTVGSYLGWRITPSIRYDLAVAYSGINYNGVSGTAQGNFGGQRWLVQTGFTGTYKAAGFMFEPSARVYALWENEGAYVDSLGTQQPNHDFSTGRASAGAKVAYPYAWSDTVALMPYVGVYSDYYFNQENAAAILATGGLPLASTPLIDGWSARITTGLGIKFASGGVIGIGAEYGGIGSNFEIWTYKAKAQVPF